MTQDERDKLIVDQHYRDLADAALSLAYPTPGYFDRDQAVELVDLLKKTVKDFIAEKAK